MESAYRYFFKRLLDFLIAVPAFLIAFPFMLIIIVLLFITGHRNIFFVQKRVGYHEKIFRLLKFSTMTNTTDTAGKLLPDEKRLTKFGILLRKTSLDELPQLLNVLKGEMSLVGPRPLLIEYLPLYSKEQRRRHTVKPGITGWAQVNGRNAISWHQKFEYDVWYVENQSFMLDLKIIFLTARNVLLRKDISQHGHVTARAFNGNN